MTKNSSVGAVMDVASRPPIVFVAGEGSWLRDSEGGSFLDFVQGWAVNCLGHTPRPVIAALARQAERLINCSPAFYNEPMIRLSELLADIAGCTKYFFPTAGPRPTKAR